MPTRRKFTPEDKCNIRREAEGEGITETARKYNLTRSICTVGVIILINFLISCKTDVNINRYIDKNIPLKLTITAINATGLSTRKNFEIAVNSLEYKKLINWGDKNVNGWKQTTASYASGVSIGQGDFRLLTIAEGTVVVVGFVDDNKKPKQFVKTIKNGNLDFLKK